MSNAWLAFCLMLVVVAQMDSKRLDTIDRVFGFAASAAIAINLIVEVSTR